MHKRKLPWRGLNLIRWEYSSVIGAITLVIGAVTLGCTIYLVNLEPNLKYSSFTFKNKIVGRKIDSKNNLVYHFSITPRFKNVSYKTGYVDKVEFVPVSINTIPDVKVISIRKTPISWRSEEDVEIQFIVTVPTDFDAKLK